MAGNNYILITPAKDEERNIHEVINSVLEQTIKPKLWIIIDDGSVDNTLKIINNYIFNYPWIKTLELPAYPRDIYQHIAYVYKRGFDYAIEYCGVNNICFHYIGVLDADTVLSRYYFEQLIDELKKDSDLGIISGEIYYEDKGKLKPEFNFFRSPHGTGRLWTKKCFFETGGYLLYSAPPDVISNTKAILRGYRIKSLPKATAVHKRRISSAEGLWKGYTLIGESWHYLNANPLLIFLSVCWYAIKPPILLMGAAFLYGYFKGRINKAEKIKDAEINYYYHHTRVKEVMRPIFNKCQFK